MKPKRYNSKWRPIAFLTLIAMTGLSLMLGPHAVAVSVVDSKHNLSASGPGTIKASTETEVCIFCHTPHHASAEAPLWNRFSSGATYTPYSSSTTKATIGQPTGASKLCLSCHDGTIALGMLRNPNITVGMQNSVTTMPTGPSNLGTDLSDDHPVSFVYDAALVAARGELSDPAALTGPVKLDRNKEMQCTSCHDPHNSQYGKFLVRDNSSGALCTTCHTKNYWASSSHSTSTKTWNGIAPDPWPSTTATTVAANACENCHTPHNAGTKQRLLNFSPEEQNCYPCHNGNVAAKNIETEFNKFSVHPVALTSGVHDPAEDPINPTRHVECADCHNPHAAKSQAATAPAVSGALAGVKGITSGGTVANPALNEYEVCFRCHADSLNRGTASVTRLFPQTNTRLEFSPSNPSFHPVEAVGKNPNVPSLISPWTASSVMYCTDCHSNDQGPGAGGSGPKGPHGSSYPPILERQLTTADNTSESAAAYALCYKCHSQSYLLGTDAVFKNHNRHVVTANIPCTACHDSHGVPAQGVGSQAHLINFDTTIVSRNTAPTPVYNSTGLGQGNCNLSCHGHPHNGTTSGTY